MDKFLKFFDDENKNVTKWNRNYFFAVSIAFIIIQIMIFGIAGDYRFVEQIAKDPTSATYNFEVILSSFLRCYAHMDWQHVLLNMFCFSFFGVYLERKIGSLKFFALILGISLVSGVSTTGIYTGLYWAGASVIIYTLMSYVIIDFILDFVYKKQNRTKIIIGISAMINSYIAMCNDFNNPKRIFWFWPHNLIYNYGHLISFIVGIVLVLIARFAQQYGDKKKLVTNKKMVSKKKSR